MSISQFIDPLEEAVYDPTEDIENYIVGRYIEGERYAESDEEISEQPKGTLAKALAALRTYRAYEESLDDGDKERIGIDEHWESDIRARAQRLAKQTSTTSYFDHVR